MTSDLGPRGRGFSRRTTSLSTSRVSPLGSGRSSGGADNRPRSTTSFRSMTERLMPPASPACLERGQGRPRVVDGPGRCGRRSSFRRWLLLLACRGLLEQPGVVALDRGRALAQQLGDRGLDVVRGDVAADLVGEGAAQLGIAGLVDLLVGGELGSPGLLRRLIDSTETEIGEVVAALLVAVLVVAGEVLGDPGQV